MAKKWLSLIWLLSAALASAAQDKPIPKADADSMRKALDTATTPIGRFNLLIGLAQYQCFKTGEYQADLDSAQSYIDEAAPLAKLIHSPNADGWLILTRSYLAQERGQKDTSIALTRQAVDKLASGTNNTYLGTAYMQLGYFYRFYTPADIDTRIPFVEKAVVAFRQGGNLERVGFSLTLLGDLYNKKRKVSKAIETEQAALAAYDSIHFKGVQQPFNELSYLYEEEGNYGEAVQNGLNALKAAEAVHDTSLPVCAMHDRLGGIYRTLDLNDLAIAHFKAALEIAIKCDNEGAVYVTITNIANVYNATNQPQQALNFLESIPPKYQRPGTELHKVSFAMAHDQTYIHLNQPKKAAPYAEMLVKLGNSPTLNYLRKDNIYRCLARYFLVTGQYSKVQLYLAKNQAFYTRYSEPFAFAQDLAVWQELDSIRGNFKSAYTHLLLYKSIMDSFQSITRARQMQQLEVQFETAKKEDSLRLKDAAIELLVQKNTLQQANLHQERVIRNGTVAGIVLALAVIGLLYRQYRLKQQSNIAISAKNGQLEHLVAEKDWLVKEIHHRVKNNFQTVMGLLGTQCGYLNSEEARTAIRDSQQRIQAMSLIHQRLYQTENLSEILVSDYVHELVDHLRDSYAVGSRTRFQLEVEPMEMDLAHCIPLGLILNEAISNSLKYAFPDGRQGSICISLRQTPDHDVELTIADNGVGLPPEFDIGALNSMGMNLMKGLCREIEARFLLWSKEGTRFDISFAYTPVKSGPVDIQ